MRSSSHCLPCTDGGAHQAGTPNTSNPEPATPARTAAAEDRGTPATPPPTPAGRATHRTEIQAQGKGGVPRRQPPADSRQRGGGRRKGEEAGGRQPTRGRWSSARPPPSNARSTRAATGTPAGDRRGRPRQRCRLWAPRNHRRLHGQARCSGGGSFYALRVAARLWRGSRRGAAADVGRRPPSLYLSRSLSFSTPFFVRAGAVASLARRVRHALRRPLGWAARRRTGGRPPCRPRLPRQR